MPPDHDPPEGLSGFELNEDLLRQSKVAFLSQAELFLDQKLYQEAEGLAEDWLRHTPSDVDARMVLCRAWMKLGKLDRVQMMLDEIEELILGLSRIYLCMGDICGRSGLRREAAGFYRKFLALNPRDDRTPEIQQKLDALLGGGEAPETPSDGAAGRPEGLQTAAAFRTVTLADLHMQQGHLEEAADILEDILRGDPGHEEARKKLLELTNLLEARRVQEERRRRVLDELARWLGNLDRTHGYAF